MSLTPPSAARRLFLRHGAHLAAAGSLAAVGVPARAAVSTTTSEGVRELSFAHTHTRERLSITYARAQEYMTDALGRLNRFMRDHYTGEVGQMDPALFDVLHRVQQTLRSNGSFEVISAYRCAATNGRLRLTGGGGVARRSLHMDGRAIDVRLPGVPLAELRDAALSLRAGGVGYYPGQQFVHIDTGRVRSW